MSISDLKKELNQSKQIEVIYVEKSKAKENWLTEESPANVRDGKIYVLDDLPDENKLQAEAHELGHLYVEQLGVLKFDPEYGEPIDYLKLELNNALSHRFIIDILNEKFNISSDYHLHLRRKGIDNTKEILQDNDEYEKEILFGLGLKLFDISITIPDTEEEIEKIIHFNKDVSLAYEAAKTYLMQMKLDMPSEEQRQIIGNFLEKLGLSLEHLS
ncbi:hypothetical protein [Ectobacillus funiculus]|uniref:hypothetical protein n=1 Tax=Ectobacillus funiculus TaxID=137993 RepID=UPI00101D00D9|nr:hypothetical protein [Ectobacillus funiculus]